MTNRVSDRCTDRISENAHARSDIGVSRNYRENYRTKPTYKDLLFMDQLPYRTWPRP